MKALEFTVQWPNRIIFGPGKLKSLADEAKLLGRRAFIVTTKELSGLGFAHRAQKLLEGVGLEVTLYEDVQPDPSCFAVDEASELARSAGCDMVVSIGGGSAIDFGKGVAVAVSHQGPIWDYVNYMGANAKPVTDKVLPHIAVPTTAGTGSEVTTSAVLDNPQKHMKASIVTPMVYPQLSIVDPELTYSMPVKVTAMTGFDALTHGMEGYLNGAKSSPASDIFALETVRLVAQNLGRVIENGDDHQARAYMSWASTLGGLSISVSSVTVAHGMGLPLGSRLHVPHGLGLSRLLPVVLARSWHVQPARYAALADTAGVTKVETDDGEKAQSLVVWLKDFIKKIGLDSMWIDLCIDDAGLNQLTDDVFAYMGRLVQVHRPVFDRVQIREMFEEALR